MYESGLFRHYIKNLQLTFTYKWVSIFSAGITNVEHGRVAGSFLRFIRYHKTLVSAQSIIFLTLNLMMGSINLSMAALVVDLAACVLIAHKKKSSR